MAKASFDKGDKFRRWERNLDNPKAALKQIGALMVSESQGAFRSQKLGDDPWPPRAVPNVFGIIADFHAGKRKPPQRRFEDRPALRDTGRLAASIAFRLQGSKVVEVGTNLPPAAVLHGGGDVESMPLTEKVQLLMGAWLLTVDDDKVFNRLAPLLHKKWRGKTLKMEVPERPIVGITKQTIADVKEAVGVKIMEAE